MKQDMKQLLKYMKTSVSPFHAVKEAEMILAAAGYQKFLPEEELSNVSSKRLYTVIHGKTLVAFSIGKPVKEGTRLKIAAAHTDQPCFHIKPKAELRAKPYLQIDTEVYGGPILNTWMDCPLSIAGKAALRGRDIYLPKTKLVDFVRPVAVIPNLAIHMNRKVNEGVELNRQVELMPLLGMFSESDDNENFFLYALAQELKVKPEEILDFDLYLYMCGEGTEVGLHNDFLTAPRLDNLSSCYAILQAMAQAKESDENAISVAVLFDHEEIGSRSKQGADSMLLSMLLGKLYHALGFTQEKKEADILNGFLLSVDAAHAFHPNFPGKYDPVNQALINHGIVIKLNSSQRYTFDTEAVATVQGLCEQAGIAFQKFANHSNEAGGTTLGPIISSWLPMKAADIGIGMLAMHSSRETVGTKDVCDLMKLMQVFLS